MGLKIQLLQNYSNTIFLVKNDNVHIPIQACHDENGDKPLHGQGVDNNIYVSYYFPLQKLGEQYYLNVLKFTT